MFEVTWSEGKEAKSVRRFELGALAHRIARISPGKRIAYVTDAGAGTENRDRIAALASGARAFSLFHLSPRYRGREVEFQEEAARAYQRVRVLNEAPISSEIASIMAG